MSSEQQTSVRTSVLNKKRRLLCVDDDKDTLELLRFIFEFAGYYVKTAETGAIAMYKLRNTLFDVYVLDHRLPDMTGLDLIKKIRAFDSSTPIIMASAEAREEEQKRALYCGAQACVTKPWQPDFLLATVKNLIDQTELRAIDAQMAETDAILQQMEDHRDMVSSCRTAHRVRDAARKAFLNAGGTYAAFHRHSPPTLAVYSQSVKRKTQASG
jgi:DNA-binding response OmpR family regulator